MSTQDWKTVIIKGNINKNNISVETDLLDKININDQDYYYEPKNNGIVYNKQNQPVGLFKNGTVIFN